MVDGQEPTADGPHTALNDFYFRPCLDEVSPTCILELDIDGEVVDQYRGDGLDHCHTHGVNRLFDGCRWAHSSSRHRSDHRFADLHHESVQPIHRGAPGLPTDGVAHGGQATGA